MDEVLDEFKMMKYHQKLLLTIALDKNPEQCNYLLEQ